MTTTRKRPALSALLSALLCYQAVLPALWAPRPAAAETAPPQAFYLDSDGGECKPNANPPPATLALTPTPPSGTAVRCKDSEGLNVLRGNPWAEIGTWTTTPAAGTLSALAPLHVFVGLKNSDDVGTQFDVLAEVFRGPALVAQSLTRCVTGLVRATQRARELTLTFPAFAPQPFTGTDVLALKLSARIGTTAEGGLCGPPGSHQNARGLRVYYDGRAFPSGLGATLGPGGNQLPAFSTTPPTVAVETIPYGYRAAANDPEGSGLTFGLVSGPPGMSVAPDTGQVTWVPGRGTAGDHPVELRATDGAGGSVSQGFTLTVVPFNLTPTFTSVPGTFLRAGQEYVYDADAHDPEGQALAFAFAEPPPAGMTVDAASGVVRWAPGAGAAGRHRVALLVTDPLGAAETQAWDLDVLDAGADLGIVSPTGTHAVAVGQTLSLPLQATDARAALSVAPLPANARVAANTLTFTPAASQVGTHTLSVRARLADMDRSSVVGITVTRSTTSSPPAIAPIAGQTVAEGGTLTFAVQATDADGDPLSYTAPGLTLPNAFFNALTRTFSFFPAGGQAGLHQVTFAVSDGQQTSQVTVPIQVTGGAGGGAQVLDLTVDPPQNPTFSPRQTITGSVRGQVGPTPPAQRPVLVTGLAPSAAAQGTAATVDITGVNTAFAQATTRADFGPGITVETLTVVSPTTARASIRVDRQAALGSRQVVLKGGGREAPSIVDFRVQPGVAVITGVVTDPFTQQPLAGATVTVQGSAISVLTDDQGRFTLSGVTPGSVTVLVTRPNYGVQTLHLVVSPSDTLTLAGPVPLSALARPASPGGTLPRAATVASVLDRGVTSKGSGLGFEQAKQVITDSLIAVGGIEVGVLDEAGRQLNPKLAGPGALSLKPEGVARHARALTQGDVVTIADLYGLLAGAFSLGATFTFVHFLHGLQHAADDAWADPANPQSGMAILLFNEGVQLSAQPPRITAGTRLNRFQVFLLLASFLVEHHAILSASADRVLAAHGISEPQLPAEAFRGGEAARTAAGAGEASAPAIRQAETVGMDCRAFSTVCEAHDRQAKRTFTVVWRKMRGNLVTNAAISAALGGLTTLLGAMVVELVVGLGTLGPVGLTAGAAAAALIAGAVAGLVATLVLQIGAGFLIAGQVGSALQPETTVTRGTSMQGGAALITFDRSASEAQAIQRRASGAVRGALGPRFAYHLYRFPSCEEPASITDAEHVPIEAQLVPDDPANRLDPPRGPLFFSIPAAELRDGANHFRIVTHQYIYNATVPLIETLTPYDTDEDGALSRDEWARAGRGGDQAFDDADLDENGAIDPAEFEVAQRGLAAGVPTDRELAPGSPELPPVRGLLGRPRLQDGTYRTTLDMTRLTFAPLEPNFDPNPGSTLLGSREVLRAQDVMRATYRGIDSFSDPADLALFLDHSDSAVRFVDGALKEVGARGQQLATQSLRVDGPRQYSGEAAVTGQDIANRLSLQHLGEPATPERIGYVNQLVDAQRRFTIQETRQAILRPEVEQAAALMRQVSEGTTSHVRFQPNGFRQLGPADMVGPAPDIYELTPGLLIDAPVTAQNQRNLREALGALTMGAGPSSDAVKGRSSSVNHASNLQDLAVEQLLIDGVATRSGLPREQVTTRVQQNISGLTGQTAKLQHVAGRLQAHREFMVRLHEFMQLSSRGITPEVSQPEPTTFESFLLRVGARGPRTPVPKHAGRLARGAGGGLTGAWAVAMFLDAIREQPSEFSPECHTFLGGPSVPLERFPPGFEPFPDDTRPNGILKEGSDGLVLEYPGEDYRPGDDNRPASEAVGFTPALIAADNGGRVLLLNADSVDRFGGRLFRFQPRLLTRPADERMDLYREFVGGITYFSLTSQTMARPVRPVAMVAGPEYPAPHEDGFTTTTQDLFVASRDLFTGGTEILKVPISLIDTKPSTYPEGGVPARDDAGRPYLDQRRQRITGTPVATFDGQLTGPSDMEVGPDPESEEPTFNENGIMVLSDEGTIYAIIPDGAGFYDMKPIIRDPARRWSGLAFDHAGTLYFADYVRGEIYVMRWPDVRALLLADEPIGIADARARGTAYTILTGLTRPGDVEVAVNGTRPSRILLVSLAKGVKPIPMPVVGTLDDRVQEVKIKRFRKEQSVAVELVPDSSPERRVFRLVPSHDDLSNGKVTLRLKRLGPNGLPVWGEKDVPLDPNGVTVVEPLD